MAKQDEKVLEIVEKMLHDYQWIEKNHKELEQKVEEYEKVSDPSVIDKIALHDEFQWINRLQNTLSLFLRPLNNLPQERAGKTEKEATSVTVACGEKIVNHMLQESHFLDKQITKAEIELKKSLTNPSTVIREKEYAKYLHLISMKRVLVRYLTSLELPYPMK